VHIGAQGFSPRTRTDAEVVRFGAVGGRIALVGERGATQLAIEVTLRVGEPKRARLNGAPLRVAEQLRSEVAALVFTPDRLAVVKGGPAVRRAYFDRALGRFWPARSSLSAEYAAAVGQRNAALRRVGAGFAPRDALDPWTDRVVELGAQLTAARRDLLAGLAEPFAAAADELGLPAAELRYEGAELTHETLEQRLQRDLDRGTTGAGPHLEDVGIAARGLELRSFGSQGEQRLAVLSLLLGEAELLTASRGVPPLLLLDDVLSELDGDRRRILARRISGRGQALVTATAQDALPAEADTLVEVVPGHARKVA
jgi:DNA replication and repair protein RecF